MGRVSFKRPVLCQFSCGLKCSSSLILKLRREKKIHFQPGSLLHWTKSIFSPKSNNSFWFGHWIVESFSAFFFFFFLLPVKKSSILIIEVNRSLKTYFPQSTRLYVHQNREKYLTVHICLDLVLRSLTPVSVCSKNHREVRIGWRADEKKKKKKTPNNEEEEERACTDTRAGESCNTVCVCVYVLYVFNLLFGAHHGRRDGGPPVSLPQLYKRPSCCFIMAGT